MKNLNSLIVLSALFFSLSCDKHDCHGKDATVVKDCTGTYLRIGDKDYHVCNTEKLNSFSGGEAVKVKYNSISDCNGPAKDGITCAMAHANEGWITIESVKKDD